MTDILKEVEQELSLMKKEIRQQEKPILNISQVFKHQINEATIQCELYYQCKIRLIPCIINVNCKHGRFDAILEINDSFFIIELKSYYYRRKSKEVEDQLSRYRDSGFPVILIKNDDNISLILNCIQNQTLSNSIYEFNKLEKSLDVYKFKYNLK